MTPREQINDLLRKLPENFSMSEFEYHLFVMKKVQTGLQAADEGRVVSQDEVERQVAKWVNG